DETKPWGSYTKDGKPITPGKLACLLWEFEIKPRTLRIEGATGKGYLKVQYEDAWERYAPLSALSQGFQSVTPSQSSEINDLEPTPAVTSDFDVTARSAANPLEISDCDGVTVSDPRTSEREREGPDDGPQVCTQCHSVPDGKERQCAYGDETIWLHPECE